VKLALALVALAACSDAASTPSNVPLGAPCTTDDQCIAAAECATGACACVAGFAEGPDGGCDFAGIVADPRFETTTAWTPAGVKTQLLTGEVDLGGGCDPGSVTQSVTMPSTRAGALVAEVTYTPFPGISEVDVGAPGVGLGPIWHDDLEPAGAPVFAQQVVRRCLGPAQYGGTMALVAATPIAGQCVDPSAQLTVQEVTIEPAMPGECADPDGGVAGWQFFAGTTSSAGYADNDPSHGITLQLGTSCEHLHADGAIAFPSSGSPALEVSEVTDAGQRPLIEVGDLALALAPSSGAAETVRACVPTAMRGGAYPLTIGLYDPYGFLGDCGFALGITTTITRIAVVDDPRCADAGGVVDAGFESLLPVLGAHTEGNTEVFTLDAPGEAHTGDGVLAVDKTEPCAAPVYTTSVIAPPPAGGSGPALSYAYRVNAALPIQFDPTNATGRVDGQVVQDNEWHVGTLCLVPGLGARAQPAAFVMTGPFAACGAGGSGSLYLDDLALTTDPSCPAK